MKIVGHTDYWAASSISTHVRDEMLKITAVKMNEVFRQQTEE